MGLIAIVIIIVVAVSLNNRISKLEELIKQQAKKDSIYSAEKKKEASFSGVESEVVAVTEVEKEQDYHDEVQRNIQESLGDESRILSTGETVLRYEHEEDSVSKFFSWLAKDWPMKVGAFLVISAIGWFVSYAFRNDWISPEGRVFLGLLFGVVLLVLGAFRSFKHRVQGNVLMVIGGISVLVAIISGVVIYELFPVEIVFIVALLVVSFLSAMAMRQKEISLGIITYTLGAIVPLFVAGDIEINTLFFYLFILTSGTLWIVYKTKWRALTVISLLVVAMYSIIFNLVEGIERNTVNLIFAFVFTAVFYLANISALISSKKVTLADMFVSMGTGLLFLLWMNLVAPEDLISIFVLMGALIFAVGSFVLYKLSSLRYPVTIYSVVSLTLLAAATVIELEGFTLTIALTTEFTLTIIVWAFLSFKEKMLKVNMLSVVLYGIPVFMSLFNLGELFDYINNFGQYNSYGLSENLFVVFYLCLAAFLIGISMLYFSVKYNKSITSQERLVLRTFLGIGGLYVTVLIWIVSHLIAMSMNQSTEIAIMVSLIIYTLIGIYFYLTGKKNNNTALRIVGDLFLAIVILRVFLVEFWGMDIVERIITLFVVGGLLVSTVFFNKEKKK